MLILAGSALLPTLVAAIAGEEQIRLFAFLVMANKHAVLGQQRVAANAQTRTKSATIRLPGV